MASAQGLQTKSCQSERKAQQPYTAGWGHFMTAHRGAAENLCLAQDNVGPKALKGASW